MKLSITSGPGEIMLYIQYVSTVGSYCIKHGVHGRLPVKHIYPGSLQILFGGDLVGVFVDGLRDPVDVGRHSGVDRG